MGKIIQVVIFEGSLIILDDAGKLWLGVGKDNKFIWKNIDLNLER